MTINDQHLLKMSHFRAISFQSFSWQFFKSYQILSW